MDLLNHSVIYFICRKRRPFWSLWHLSHNSLCSKVKSFLEFQDTFCFFFFVIFSREGKCKNRIKNNRCQNKTINHIVKNIICENLDPCRFLSFWQQQHAESVASWRLVNLPCPHLNVSYTTLTGTVAGCESNPVLWLTVMALFRTLVKPKT